MGGFFGTISTKECIDDLFYGTDYNSHLGTKRAGMVTFDKEKGFDALSDWTKPKLVLDNRNYALYFSRSVIPYIRNKETGEWAESFPFLMHVGMYAYRASVLEEITRLPQSSLEIAESLEQLRWLQNGYKIKVGLTEHETIGIDTPADLERANKFLESSNLQQ